MFTVSGCCSFTGTKAVLTSINSIRFQALEKTSSSASIGHVGLEWPRLVRYDVSECMTEAY